MYVRFFYWGGGVVDVPNYSTSKRLIINGVACP